MNRPLLLAVLGAVLLAGCDQSAVVDPAPMGPTVEGRWISLVVENAGDPDQHLSIVDDRDLARVVGIAEPATVPGDTTMQVRLFVPDDIPWMLRSNEMLLISTGDVAGFCGRLPVEVHVAWGAGSVEVPIWMGEPSGFPGRPPDNCETSDRTTLTVPAAP